MIDSLLLMLDTCMSDSAKWPLGCKQVGEQSDSGNCALTTGTMSSHPLHEPGNALKLDPIGFCSCFLSFITGGNWHESVVLLIEGHCRVTPKLADWGQAILWLLGGLFTAQDRNGYLWGCTSCDSVERCYQPGTHTCHHCPAALLELFQTCVAICCCPNPKQGEFWCVACWQFYSHLLSVLPLPKLDCGMLKGDAWLAFRLQWHIRWQ
jgi:hypothetical protein